MKRGEKREPKAGSPTPLSSHSNSKPDAVASSGYGKTEAKKLRDDIAAHCASEHNVILSSKNKSDLLEEIMGAPLQPPEVWLWVIGERAKAIALILDELDAVVTDEPESEEAIF